MPGAVGAREHRAGRAAAALPRRRGLARQAGPRSSTRSCKRLRIKASSPDQKVGELSGGNQQKVLLARLAVHWNPRSCCSTNRPAASTSAPRPRCRASSTNSPREGLARGADLLRARGARRGRRPDRRAARRSVVGEPGPATETSRGGTLLQATRRRSRDPDLRRARTADRATAGADSAGCRTTASTSPSPCCCSSTSCSPTNFLTAGQPPHPARPGRAGADRRARHGAGHRHRGRRPVASAR